MKLKQLHIRNIASIERGDIDFERDLCDPVTGLPSPLFLICGDTGSGKTVILDCISLALYGTTPRVESVEDSSKNNYLNAEGELMAVKNVEQYTRLGISTKDECYAELTFEGNDGHTYTSRLSLGMQRDNKTKGIKHRKRSWQVTIDGERVVSGQKECKSIVREAISLSFEQFGRVAMLAQGQFANFLTGKKKEREEILEQLTNTEHFTRYGEAISAFTKRAADACKMCEATYKAEQEHILSEEEQASLEADLRGLIADQRQQREIVGRTEKMLSLYRQMAGFARACVDAKEALEVCRSEFAEMRRRVAATRRYASAKLLEIEEQRKDIDSQSEWASLYASAQTVAEKFAALRRAEADMKRIANEKSATSTQALPLQNSMEVASEALEEVKKRVEAAQEQIEAATIRRSELHPQEIVSALNEKHKEMEALQSIVNKCEGMSLAKKEEEEMLLKVRDMEAHGEQLKKKMVEAEKKQKKAKEEDDKARNILQLMKASVEEAMVALRRRLAQDHARNCPLCGQHIHHIALDEEFENMILPHQRLQQATAEALQKANEILEKAKGDYDAHNKNVIIMHAHVHDATKRWQTLFKEVREQIVRFDIPSDSDIRQHALLWIETTTKSIDGLSRRHQQAENLQKEFEQMLKDKRKIERDLAKAESTLRNCEKKVEANKSTMASLHSQHTLRDKERANLVEELNSLLLIHYPHWMEAPLQIEEDLLQRSSEYQQKVKALESAETAAALLESRLVNVTLLEEKILELMPSEEESEESEESEEKAEKDGEKGETKDYSHQISSEAASLYANVSSLVNARDDNRRKGLECEKELTPMLEPNEKPNEEILNERRQEQTARLEEIISRQSVVESRLKTDQENQKRFKEIEKRLAGLMAERDRWRKVDARFGGTRFRTLVQSYILRPLLNNANIYLSRFTDRYALICSEENEQLSILVTDKYNKDQVRSATVLSGGERFMISLALSLALSSLNRPDMNVDILFIDEGFGTLDERSLDSVMATLENLQELAGNGGRRVGIISHREELAERIPTQLRVSRHGEGRSRLLINQ